jgi:hypothetical protein
MLISRAMLAVTLAAALALPATAQHQPGQKEESTGAKVREAAAQPIEDINLKRDRIPPAIERILDDPYSLDGLGRCKLLAAAIVELDDVLGPDIDVNMPEDKGKKRRDTVIRLSGNFLSNLILPFRGVVREVSGSAEAKRDYEAAIVTGVARRSFLKGVATARGCALPPPPAVPPVKPDDVSKPSE